MSFYQRFFKVYSTFIGKESYWKLIDEHGKNVDVEASSTNVFPEEFPDFKPCYCDAGHPYLTALRTAPKECSCKGPTYLKILFKSDIAVNSLLVRSVALYCINGLKSQTSWPDSPVVKGSLFGGDKKYQ